MTIPVSTAPAAKAWLFGKLKTAVTAVPTNSLQVLYDNVTTANVAPDDAVVVGDITNRRLDGLAFVGSEGPSAFTETYDLNVLISIYRQGSNPQAATERAWAILAQIETVTRTDPTFGGKDTPSAPLLYFSKPRDTSSHITPSENGAGYVCEIPLAIQCQAEL